MQWFYAQDGKPVGPVTEEVIRGEAAAGRITAETLVWHEGMPAWAAYGSMPGVIPEPAQDATVPAGGTAAQLTCCECGRSFPADEVIQFEGSSICAQCKPVFFQRLQEGAVPPSLRVYGGFWIRFLAKFIDGLILGTVNVIIMFAGIGLAVGMAGTNRPAAVLSLQAALWVVQILTGAAFTVFFLGKYQATPGKMACRLKVVRSDGGRITYGRACGRYFGEMLSGLTLYIGYIMAAFDDQKRALHDRVCDTRVVRTDIGTSGA